MHTRQLTPLSAKAQQLIGATMSLPMAHSLHMFRRARRANTTHRNEDEHAHVVGRNHTHALPRRRAQYRAQQRPRRPAMQRCAAIPHNASLPPLGPLRPPCRPCPNDLGRLDLDVGIVEFAVGLGLLVVQVVRRYVSPTYMRRSTAASGICPLPLIYNNVFGRQRTSLVVASYSASHSCIVCVLAPFESIRSVYHVSLEQQPMMLVYPSRWARLECLRARFVCSLAFGRSIHIIHRHVNTILPRPGPSFASFVEPKSDLHIWQRYIRTSSIVWQGWHSSFVMPSPCSVSSNI